MLGGWNEWIKRKKNISDVCQVQSSLIDSFTFCCMCLRILQWSCGNIINKLFWFIDTLFINSESVVLQENFPNPESFIIIKVKIVFRRGRSSSYWSYFLLFQFNKINSSSNSEIMGIRKLLNYYFLNILYIYFHSVRYRLSSKRFVIIYIVIIYISRLGRLQPTSPFYGLLLRYLIVAITL